MRQSCFPLEGQEDIQYRTDKPSSTFSPPTHPLLLVDLGYSSISSRKVSISVVYLIPALRPANQFVIWVANTSSFTSHREHSLPPVKSVNLGNDTLGSICVI